MGTRIRPGHGFPARGRRTDYSQHAARVEKTLKGAKGGLNNRGEGLGENHVDGSGWGRGYGLSLFCPDEEGAGAGGLWDVSGRKEVGVLESASRPAQFQTRRR